MAERRQNQQGQNQQASRASRQPQQSQSASRQQQGGQGSASQQQQFDQGVAQQGGGTSGERLADRIRPHQDVVDQNGALVGTVDHVDGDRIKLTRSSSSDGEHHYVPLSQVAGIEGEQIRLRDRGDASFGMEGQT